MSTASGSVTPTPAAAGDGSGSEGVDVVPGAMASLQTLTDAPPSEWVESRGSVTVPRLTWLAIGLAVAFTVVFGIIPGPIVDFAHQATLLFT